jgi:hypothetical protein
VIKKERYLKFSITVLDSDLMAEKPGIDFIIPYDVARANSGTHSQLRLTYGGKIINLGPTQPYKNPVTQEVSNQPYKYSNPTGTPWDMNLNYIPGMQPFQWDLASLVVTFAAPFIGLADGLTDKSAGRALIREINERHPAPTNIPDVVIKKDEDGRGGGAAGGLRGAPSSWFKKILSVNGKGYRIKVGGSDGKLNLDENVHESGDVSIYERLMNAKDAKWIKFEALGKNGKLDLFDGSYYQY